MISSAYRIALLHYWIKAILLLKLNGLIADALVGILRLRLYRASMHLSNMALRGAFIQIMEVLRALIFLIRRLPKRLLDLGGVFRVLLVRINELVRQRLVLTRLNALELTTLLFREVIVVISQFLGMDPFNKSRLHTVSRWVISVY
jgi:hypothetical protein